MRRLPLHRVARGVDAQGNDRVETQEEHVHQVFLTEQIGRQVRMEQTQTAQTIRAHAAARQFGNEQTAGLAHDDHFHAPPAVDEQADLAAHSARQKSKLARLLKRIDVSLRKASVEQALQALGLTGLQSLEISFEAGNTSLRGGYRSRSARHSATWPQRPAKP